MRKISVLAIIGVLLTGACGDGWAASSLNTSGTNSPRVMRASSLHVGGAARSASLGGVISPKQVGMKSVHGTATTPMARSASLSRSSVGRYVGASKEQSVSMEALPNPLLQNISDIENRVANTEGRLDTTEERLDTAETTISDLQDAVSNLSQTQADWNETDDTLPSYILNKPTNVSNFTNDANYITADEVPAQVQADWEEADENASAYIKNKPNMSGFATAAQGTTADTTAATVATYGDIVTHNASEFATAANAATKDLDNLTATGKANVSAEGTYDASTDYTNGTVGAAIKGKQDTIADLSDIRSNAIAGAGAASTIATYGNIVTHNASEFATAAQGTTADTIAATVATYGDIVTHNASEFATAAQGTTADTTAATVATYGDIVTHNASEFAGATATTNALADKQDKSDSRVAEGTYNIISQGNGVGANLTALDVKIGDVPENSTVMQEITALAGRVTAIETYLSSIDSNWNQPEP